MATTSLPTSQQLDWSGNALLVQDVVATGTIYQGTPASNAGSTYSASLTADNGKTIYLNALAGSVVTLPALATTGSGAKIRFLVSVLATSASHKIQVANGTDVMAGVVSMVDTDTAGTITGFATASTSDTITLNRTTTGSVTKGEWIEVEDIGGKIWAVRGVLSNSGDGATPFSAAVS